MRKIKYVIVLLFLSLSSCKNTYSAYSIMHLDDYDYNATSKTCFTDFVKKGHAISFNFDLIGNNKKHVLNISLKSKENFQKFFLNKIIINYDSMNYEIQFDKEILIKSNYEDLQFVGADIKCYQYFFKFPLDDSDFFSKLNEFNITDSYENLRIIFFYGFDDKEEFQITCLYKIKKYNRKRSAPDFIYKHIPEMGI